VLLDLVVLSSGLLVAEQVEIYLLQLQQQQVDLVQRGAVLLQAVVVQLVLDQTQGQMLGQTLVVVEEETLIQMMAIVVQEVLVVRVSSSLHILHKYIQNFKVLNNKNNS
jgi:hypothetical protein